MKILTLGPKGTFSELACITYLKQINQKIDILFQPSFFDVIANLSNNDLAILPFENSTDGFIQQTLDLLYQNDLKIISTLSVDVSYQFVSNYPINSKSPLYVQFTAVNQTSKFINKHQLFNQVLTESNSDSLARVKNDILTAAIIPSHIKTTYPYVYDHIEDNNNNQTRFIVVSKGKYVLNKDITKASLFVEFKEDKSGMLYDLLSFFKNHDINITAILSRPNKKNDGAYYFFLELDVHDTKIINLINDLSILNNNYQIKISGLY